VRASVGVTWTRTPGATPGAVIATADRGMYQAKRARTPEPIYAQHV
jgi:PleD family two-component response regulator